MYRELYNIFISFYHNIIKNCDFCLDIIGQNGDRHCKVFFYLHLSVIRLRLRLKPVTMVFYGTGEKQVL